MTENLFADTEKQLEILEDHIKDVTLEKQIKDYSNKMVLLQKEKYAGLDRLKGIKDQNNQKIKLPTYQLYCISVDQLALEHVKQIKENEIKQMLIAKERSIIFEEAFESEIQQYKQSGVIQSITTLS